ncbi:hypothetical protein [Pseudomonas nabeulensis]|uniref:hypothetical protein n=1 Tax=Pseudomonas nabeulensis TaxID=2293833 RepID=UPI0010766FA3|nr:hypothetical protein [Pseudomonas nabeulensis]
MDGYTTASPPLGKPTDPIANCGSYIIAHRADYHRLLLDVPPANKVGKEKLFIHPKLMQLLNRDSNDFKPYA